AFFGQGTSKSDAFALMDAAWDAGITTFDTADAYGGGSSEAFIGEWLLTKDAAARDRIVIATKTYNPMTEDADNGLSPARIARQIDTSLCRLGVERVALYLAHAFDPEVPLEETQSAFDELVRAGKIGAAGASNFSDVQLSQALDSARTCQGRFEWVQNSFSLLERDDAGDVVPRCQAEGLGYTPFSPLAGGWLTGKYRRSQAPPPGSRMTLRPEPYEAYRTEAVFDALDSLDALAAELDTTMAVLALAWALAQPGVTAIVIGPNRVEHLQTALDAATSSITPDVLNHLSELFS
ncbi:MAG: aldo/keto reductase, partial [Actinomycetota bacterium]|nr:aldo/keto reductase [Actinomycetota bacterium]